MDIAAIIFGTVSAEYDFIPSLMLFMFTSATPEHTNIINTIALKLTNNLVLIFKFLILPPLYFFDFKTLII